MRRESYVFIDSNEAKSKPRYCRKCDESYSILAKLLPRYQNGIEDEIFRICERCGSIEAIADSKALLQFEPKASIPDNPHSSGTRVKVTNEHRKIKSKKDSNPIEEIEIPDLAGKEDIETKSLISDRVGILNYLNDSVLDDLGDY